MKKKIGDIFVSKGIIDQDTLDIALLDKKDKKIGDYLIDNGIIAEELFYQTLSEHFMIPYLDILELEISTKALDAIDKGTLEEYNAFPIDLIGSMLTLAIEEPQDKEKIEFLSDKLELEIHPVFAKKKDIITLIDQFYNIDSDMVNLLESNSNENRKGDKNEINAVNKFSNIVIDNENVIASLNMTALGVTVENSSVDLGRERELNYVINFILRTSGYKDKDGVYNTEIPYKDNLIHTSLIIKSVGLNKEIWLEAVRIKKTSDNNQVIKDLELDNGLYVISNNKFKYNKEFIDSLLSIKNNVLIYTSDKTFENYGLKTFYDNIDLVKNYSSFADVFVFENGWSGNLTEPVLSLLNKGKAVILQLPFDEDMCLEFMEDNNKSLSVLLDDIIKLD